MGGGGIGWWGGGGGGGGGVGGFVLLALPAFPPSVISSFFAKNKGSEGGRAPQAPILDPPLSIG